MDDARAVGRGDGGADLAHEDDGVLGSEPAVADDLAPQRPPFEELHDYVGADVRIDARVVDGDDVRVVEPRDGERLSPEPLRVLTARAEVAADHLHRGRPVQVQVLGPVDAALRAAAEQRLDAVLSVDDPAEHRVGQE